MKRIDTEYITCSYIRWRQKGAGETLCFENEMIQWWKTMIRTENQFSNSMLYTLKTVIQIEKVPKFWNKFEFQAKIKQSCLFS